VLVSSAVLPFIRKCGTDPFHQILFTDHHGLFLDIDLKGLLGGELAQILAPKSRGVSSNTDKPEVCIQASHQHLSANNVFTTSASVFAAARTFRAVPNALITAINKFDRTITQGMLLAERLCRRKPRAAWSTAIAAASRTVKFWKTLISGLTTAVDVSAVLQQIGTCLKWDDIPFDTSLPDAKAHLTVAYKNIRACRKNANDLRQSFRDDRIEAAAQADDTTKEKLLKTLRHREAQSACFAKLANALKPAGNRGGVTKVELEIDGEVAAYTENEEP
jgi:hypothetical protein